MASIKTGPPIRRSGLHIRQALNGSNCSMGRGPSNKSKTLIPAMSGSSMEKRRKLIIVGGSDVELAYEHCTFDSDYEVVSALRLLLGQKTAF